MIHFHFIRTRYFRAGVGTVIYTDSGEVAIFRRAQPPVDIWQFQQGGIDLGESIESTLWRELKEEVGLSKVDIASVIEMPYWLAYQDGNTDTDHTIDRLGQVHRWFFLKLNSDTQINLQNAIDDEFFDWRFTTFEEALRLTSDHKKFVYDTLQRYFNNYIKI